MGKDEYLRQLERLLYDIPAEDRAEALQFYRDYLLDAGEEAEEVLRALGTPQELAESIRKDLYGDNAEGDFSRTYKEVPTIYRVPFSKDDRGTERRYSGSESVYEEKKAGRGRLTAGQWIVFILLCIAAAPVVLPLGGALLAVLAALAIAAIAVVFGLGAAAAAFVIAAIAVIIFALIKMVFSPFSSLVMLGGGLLLGGCGLIGFVVTVWIFVKIFPAVFSCIIKACTEICTKIFR